MHWPQSLRASLTLWYILVLGLPLVAFAGASFLVLDRALMHRSDAFLDETLGAFMTELASEQIEEPTTTEAITASLHDVQFRDGDRKGICRPHPPFRASPAPQHVQVGKERSVTRRGNGEIRRASGVVRLSGGASGHDRHSARHPDVPVGSVSDTIEPDERHR